MNENLLKTEEWEKSYRNKDNFLFVPHEEVVRFFSKYIRKRTGLLEFEDITPFTKRVPRILDLGCGIGRHVIFSAKMGLNAYGIDLAPAAVETAHQLAETEGLPHLAEKIKQGDIRKLPWGDGFFDFIISHGVLDSVPFEIAKEGIMECARVMGEGGLFYCDLISGDNSLHGREFTGEEKVGTKHEEGTIQLYFNFTSIEKLFLPAFDLIECLLIRRENVIAGGYQSRYHLVLRKHSA